MSSIQHHSSIGITNVKYDKDASITSFYNEKAIAREAAPTDASSKTTKASEKQVKSIENKLVIGLRELSFLHSGVIKDDCGGATPALNNLETPLDYYSKNKERLDKLVGLYSETLKNIMHADTSYRSVLELVKKGFTDIISELMSKIQIDPYTHLGGRMQVLENHRKVLEEKMSLYRDDVQDLEKKLMQKDIELDNTLGESKKIFNEKESMDQKLKELKNKVMFTKECIRFENNTELIKACATNGKSFSTRSYHTPSPVKKIKEIAERKEFNLTV